MQGLMRQNNTPWFFSTAPLRQCFRSPWVTLGKVHQGQGIIELAAGLIMFVSLLSLMIASTMYLYVQQVATSAVREGARVASLSADLSSAQTQAAAVAAIKQTVVDTAAASGLTVDPNHITVTPPNSQAAMGSRRVGVKLEFDWHNLIPSGTFANAFQAPPEEGQPVQSGGSALDVAHIAAQAVMHFEE